MHIELIGCTSAGKTTLAQKIVKVAKSQNIDFILGDDFVLQRLNMQWIKNEFMRRRLLEFCSAGISVWYWQKYREFFRFAFAAIFQAPGSWLYKANLVRVVLRKVGIFEIIRRRSSEKQLVLVDNEGIVQSAHSLFVHSNGSLSGDVLSFIKSAPLPDMVVYLRQSESILLERTLKRGHPRIRARSQDKVQHFIEQAAKTFENLQRVPQIADRLIVIDSESKTVTKHGSRNGQMVDKTYHLMQMSIENDVSENEPNRTTPHIQANAPCLELVNRLVDLLDAEGVRYCHWKSNINLKEALSGEEDLDIFVGEKSKSRMLRVLAQLGFKEAKIIYGSETPGVTHYYGFDAMSGKLVHLHLFSSVLTGESFVKSHLFPFEKMLLENCDRVGKLAVLSKHAELVLFVMRTFIKYGSLLDMIRLFRKPSDVSNELNWLLENGDIAKTLSLRSEHCPKVSEPLFLSCIEAINENYSFFRRVVLALQVRRRLRSYAKYNFVTRLFAYAQVLWAKLWRSLKGNVKNKALHSGGAVIAFVGSDGTGKSTIVAETSRWLGKVFAVRTVHAGKPPFTWQTFPVNVILPLARRCMPKLRQSQVKLAKPESLQSEEQKSSLLYAIRAVALAWDRRQLLAKCRRAASKGYIVICDRYPSEIPGAMDSPRLATKSGRGMQTAIKNRLAQLEMRFYEQIPPPDLVFRMKVSVETAKLRNRARSKEGRDPEEFIEIRHRNNVKWNRVGTRHIFDIDAEPSISEIMEQVKKVFWNTI